MTAQHSEEDGSTKFRERRKGHVKQSDHYHIHIMSVPYKGQQKELTLGTPILYNKQGRWHLFKVVQIKHQFNRYPLLAKW